MKSTKINHQIELEGIKTLVIENDMAPLTIEGYDGEVIEVDAKIPLEQEDFGAIEEIFQFSQQGDRGKLFLERIPELSEGLFSSRMPKINLKVPASIRLEVETEHMPVYISGMDSSLKIESENGPIVVSNCIGECEIDSENGPMKLRNIHGDIKIGMENAPLSAEALMGDSFKLETENGPIKIRTASFPKVKIESENGSIYYETLPLEEADFEIESENGNIHLALPLDFDFELEAEIENGRLSNSIDAKWEQTEDKIRIWRGESEVKIRLKTENGMIRLSPDGHINLDFLRHKLDALKDAINNSKTLQDKEEIQKHLHNVVDYIGKMTDSINEEKIKTSVNAAIDKLKASISTFDVNETKEKVSSAVEEFAREVSQTLGSFWEKIRGKMGQEFQSSRVRGHIRHLQDEMRGVGDQITKALKGAKLKNWMGHTPDDEHERMTDRSRLKILEMLESGKLTAEEAERLLKAIGKE